MLLKRKGYLVEVTTKIISLNLCKALMQETSVHFLSINLKAWSIPRFEISTFQVLEKGCNKVSLQKLSKKNDHAGVNLLTFGDTDICVGLSSPAPLVASTGKESLWNVDVGQLVKPTLSSSPVSESGVATSLSWSPRISQTACGNSWRCKIKHHHHSLQRKSNDKITHGLKTPLILESEQLF